MFSYKLYIIIDMFGCKPRVLDIVVAKLNFSFLTFFAFAILVSVRKMI